MEPWLGIPYVVGTALAAGAVAVSVVALLVFVLDRVNGSTDGGDSGEEPRDDGWRPGDGDADEPEPPRPPTGGAEPEWWPRFEREFADDVRFDHRDPVVRR